jgi:hypothetical protein
LLSTTACGDKEEPGNGEERGFEHCVSRGLRIMPQGKPKLCAWTRFHDFVSTRFAGCSIDLELSSLAVSK